MDQQRHLQGTDCKSTLRQEKIEQSNEGQALESRDQLLFEYMATTMPTFDTPGPRLPAKSSQVLNTCDECRARKLKCSGESTGCTRCIADSIRCHYSTRKQMGRPRKRRREDGAPHQDHVPRGSSFAEVEFSNPQEAMPNVQLPVSDTYYAMSNESRSMAPWDLDINLDMPQEFRTTPFVDFPVNLPCGDIQDSTFNESGTHLQTPCSILNDYSGLVETSMQASRCRCLPQLYSFLGSFQSIPNPSFPYSMAALKRVAGFATEAVQCQDCSKDYTHALQNSMLLGTLMDLVINEYRKLLQHIDERSTGSEKMTLRMGELSPGTEHLHTGTLDCPMGISVDLSGDEWRLLARKTVRKELYGPGDHNLAQLLQDMQDRQQIWHSQKVAKHQHPESTGEAEDTQERGTSKCICTQLLFIDRIKQKLDALNVR